jgi:hypothetical protein
LAIEQSVIEKVKAFAKNRNKSVSRIVEEYLRTISTGTDTLSSSGKMDSPITDRIAGMFEDSGEEYALVLENELLDKHL